MPLQKVSYWTEKANIIFLPTLPLNKFLIAETIEILKKYLKRLGIRDIIIINKFFIFKGDFFTIPNVIKAIY